MKKVVLITGVSSGIGLDVAKNFIKNGYIVYGISRKPFKLEGLTHIACDVSSLEECKIAVSKVIAQQGRLDLLINNAGMGTSGSIEYTSEEDARKIFDINFFGTFFMCKVSLPYIRESKGRIINVSSIASKMFIPFQGFYSATKTAVDAISAALRAETKPYGIKIINVLPGDTKTDFTANRIKQDDGIYNERYIKSITQMEKDEQNGMSSQYVAKVIYKTATQKRPPLTRAIGNPYKTLLFISKFLPNRLIEWVISKIYA